MTKNQIYIGIIVGCVAATAGLLYYNSQSGGGSVDLPPGITPINTNIDPVSSSSVQTGSIGNLPVPGGVVSHSTPAVFPEDSSIDVRVFESSRFKSLVDYVPITVTSEEIGRDNPFVPY